MHVQNLNVNCTQYLRRQRGCLILSTVHIVIDLNSKQKKKMCVRMRWNTAGTNHQPNLRIYFCESHSNWIFHVIRSVSHSCRFSRLVSSSIWLGRRYTKTKCNAKSIFARPHYAQFFLVCVFFSYARPPESKFIESILKSYCTLVPSLRISNETQMQSGRIKSSWVIA